MACTGNRWQKAEGLLNSNRTAMVKENELKRLVRQSNRVKRRYIEEILNQIRMSISTEHPPKPYIECAEIFHFVSVCLNY